MTIYRRRDGSIAAEEEALDSDVVRDGFSISVPLMLRDTNDAIAGSRFSGFHDGRGGPAGFRPGYCIPVGDAEQRRRRRAVEDAYREAERADAEAWRHPKSPTDAGFVAAEVPDHLTADALQMLDERERAYREAAWADETAWKNVRP